MKNKKEFKVCLILSVIMFLCFIGYTYLVANVDVRPVGECDSKVGFADVNEAFYEKIGYSSVVYKVSEILGYLAIALVGVWGVMGLMQLIKGKGLKAVDSRLYVLAGGYVAMLAFYVLFEKVVINCRPVIVDAKEGLEASFPSSHTFLAIFVCLSSIVMYSAYIKKINYRKIATVATVILMCAIIITRFLSGAHWFTDIVGAIILGTALFSAFGAVLIKIDK